MEILYIGAKWCRSCTIIKPGIEELAKKYGLVFKYLDYDKDIEEWQHEIKKVPTVRIMNTTTGTKVAEFDYDQIVATTNWLSENVTISACDDF